ncbi:hypothetical protein RMATCC62417_11613 [Rhizopus microsporus]|nr:hypothetical protein RMATCC62417_11613 [Rhizopus microsporus]
MAKGKAVRIKSEEDECQLTPDMIPLVSPPSATHLSRRTSTDDPSSITIEMQQEDPYFYDKNTRPPHESWSSAKTIENPFGDDISKQNTLVSSNMDEKQEISNSTTVTGDEDSDREFDWNDDPDQVKPKRRKTAKERFQAAMRNPCCWHYLSPLLKRIIIAIFGSCMFIIVAIVIYFTLPKPTDAEQQNPLFKNVRSNVQCWMYWAAFMWHIFWVTTFTLDSVPSIVSLWIKTFRGRRSERAKSYMESLKILDTLSKAEKKNRPASGPGRANRGNNKLRHRRSPQWDSDQGSRRPVTLSDAPVPQQPSSFDIFKKSISNIVLAEKPTSDVSGRLEKNKMDINSDDYAKKVAKKLFYSLAYPDGHLPGHDEDTKLKLEIHHFIPYFKDHDEAKEAFKVFDKDGNGNLTRREFRDTVVQIYRERKGLAQAIRDTSQALGKIDATLLVISCLITLFVSLSIFRVDFWASLIPFGTLLAACTFIFDTSAKALCQGIIFQFVTHPYDAGDLVMIDNAYMTVENIGILGTVFVSGDGCKLYAPTTLLLTKIITNVRRSGNMGETLTFNIDFRTDNDTIHLLRERLSEWVQSQSRDFAPGFDLRVSQIIDMNQIILTAWLPHKGNWVELGKRFQRKTRFMLALKSILTELDIKYELPAQRITSTNQNPFDMSQSLKPQNFGEQESHRSN